MKEVLVYAIIDGISDIVFNPTMYEASTLPDLIKRLDHYEQSHVYKTKKLSMTFPNPVLDSLNSEFEEEKHQ